MVSCHSTWTLASLARGMISITPPHCDSSHFTSVGVISITLPHCDSRHFISVGVMSITLPHCDSSHCSYGGDEYHSTPLWLQPLQLWGWWVSLYPTVTPATAAMGVMSFTLPHCDSSHCSYGGDEYHSTPLWLQPLQLSGGDEYHSTPLWLQPLQLWGWWVSLYPTVTPATAAMGVMSITLPHCDSSHCSYGGDEFHSTPLWLQPLQLWGWWVSLYPTVTPATAAMGVMSITLPHCDSSHCSSVGVMSITLPHCDSSHCSYGGDEYHSTPLWLQPLQLWGWYEYHSTPLWLQPLHLSGGD